MRSTGQHVVIVGAGAAGHAAATALRRQGFEERVTLVHGEDPAPYNRTLVDKAVLPGILTPAQAALPDLTPLGVEVVRARVRAVDVTAREVVLDDGGRLRFAALVAATGSTPRPLPLAAGGTGRLLHLHTTADAEHLRDRLGADPARVRVTLLGAGLIGSEVASHLSGLGVDVHLVARPELPLADVLGAEVARRVARLHRVHVRTHFGRTVVDVRAHTDALMVTLDDGSRLESEVAVVAHGTVPASGWLTGADGGVAVDGRLRAHTRPGVYAAGGVAVHADSAGRPFRIDHWDAATAQGEHAARTVLHDLVGAADPGPYLPLTGFTTSLYGRAIAAYGVAPAGADQQHRTVGDEGVLTTFGAPGGEAITAAAGLGAGRELMELRRLLARP